MPNQKKAKSKTNVSSKTGSSAPHVTTTNTTGKNPHTANNTTWNSNSNKTGSKQDNCGDC